MTTLTRHGHIAVVAASASGALCNLARRDDSIAAIVESGAIPPLIAALRTHADRGYRVVEGGACALLFLSRLPAGMVSILTGGGIEAVVAALSATSTSAMALGRSCAFVAQLCSVVANRRLLIRAGAAAALKAVMTAHRDNAALVKAVRTALARLTQYST